jgi:hypothetical protein
MKKNGHRRTPRPSPEHSLVGEHGAAQAQARGKLS